MALIPVDKAHALQIQAGTLGRKAGHAFEDAVTQTINALRYPFQPSPLGGGHVFSGDPASLLLAYIAAREKLGTITRSEALSTGALATSEAGKQWLSVNGAVVTRCKSDLIVTLTGGGRTVTVGISTKQCNNPLPTNAQLYFTTASRFCWLLRNHGIMVSDTALTALRQFCGDPGFRPSDHPAATRQRRSDPRRYFWEEIDAQGRSEWERVFQVRQDDISRLLFQKAYMDDPFVPDYVLHKTKASPAGHAEVAIYTVNELVSLSRRYQTFATRPYAVRKGSYKDPPGVMHQAPRFGVIQMQRGGQRQHPEQLQFNLEAGYFYRI